MKAAAFVFATGLLVTLGAVGGIEHTEQILDGMITAAVGLAVMYCGTLMLGRSVDN